jgi:hypothetical protein
VEFTYVELIGGAELGSGSAQRERWGGCNG